MIKLRLKIQHYNVNTFGYENDLTFPIYLSSKKFEDYMDLPLITDNNNSHCV